MTEDDLRQALKARGWGLHYHARRKTGKRYAYARRRYQGKILTKYLSPEHKIEELTPETIEQKLT